MNEEKATAEMKLPCIADYVRVTTVANLLTDFSSIPKAALDAAAERGTMVHKLCSAQVSGLPVFSVSPLIDGYMRSFNQWFEANIDDVLIYDKRFFCNHMGITGEVDLVARLKGEDTYTLIDYKTSAVRYRSWDVQCAGYHYLLAQEGIDVRKHLLLRLKKDGSGCIANAVENVLEAHEVFFSLLKCVKYLNIKPKYEVE